MAPSPHVPQEHPERMYKQWHEEYKKNGGKHSFEEFKKNQRKFEELTFDSFVVGVALYRSKDQAWKEWVNHIGSQEEAKRYFDAIDKITPYT